MAGVQTTIEAEDIRVSQAFVDGMSIKAFFEIDEEPKIFEHLESFEIVN